MLLYNITVIIEEVIEHEWLTWIRSTHIPQIMATNAFTSNRLLKVLDSPNEGITYCIQYIADSRADFDHYRQNFESRFQSQLASAFANQSVSFNTIMEFIDYQ